MIAGPAAAARTGGATCSPPPCATAGPRIAGAARCLRRRARRALAGAACATQLNPPLWEAGHVGWFQDCWIARNPQRALGIRCDPDHHATGWPRCRRADALYNSSRVAARHALAAAAARSGGHPRRTWPRSLADTLDLLAAAAPKTDDALYFFRLVAVPRGHAHRGRDLHGAGAGDFSARRAAESRASRPPATAHLHLPAQAWTLGYVGDGFAFDNELNAHAVERRVL
ncbi:MAG: hypothetical protein MZW92_81285 [Comamonadaceae bacterium]|nr:hypothetical protein [Comamonadaceae bacterium]